MNVQSRITLIQNHFYWVDLLLLFLFLNSHYFELLPSSNYIYEQYMLRTPILSLDMHWIRNQPIWIYYIISSQVRMLSAHLMMLRKTGIPFQSDAILLWKQILLCYRYPQTFCCWSTINLYQILKNRHQKPKH